MDRIESLRRRRDEITKQLEALEALQGDLKDRAKRSKRAPRIVTGVTNEVPVPGPSE